MRQTLCIRDHFTFTCGKMKDTQVAGQSHALVQVGTMQLTELPSNTPQANQHVLEEPAGFVAYLPETQLLNI